MGTAGLPRAAVGCEGPAYFSGVVHLAGAVALGQRQLPLYSEVHFNVQASPQATDNSFEWENAILISAYLLNLQCRLEVPHFSPEARLLHRPYRSIARCLGPHAQTFCHVE